MKRICLFAGYNKNGVIEDYVVYYIKELSKYADVYYYGDFNANENELKKLTPYVKGAYASRHAKYDFGSWQELVKEIGIKEIRKYDKLILANDSCYGPLFSLDSLFNEMDQKPEDFWGLSCSVGYHVHIQSYFICFNKSVINADYLFDFLDKVKPEKSLREVCDNYEDMLAFYLSNNGFEFTSFIPLEEKKLHPYYETWACIKEKRFPLLKVKNFTSPSVGYDKMSDYKSFISENTSYDYKLIETDLEHRNMTEKEINDNLMHNNLAKPKSSFKQKIKSLLGKIIRPIWKKYISKFDYRIEHIQENINSVKIENNDKYELLNKKLDKMICINNSKDDFNNFIFKYINIKNKLSVEIVNNEKTFEQEKDSFNIDAELFNKSLRNYPLFMKNPKCNLLFYGSNNVEMLTSLLFNSCDITLFNQELTDSSESKLLKNVTYEIDLGNEFLLKNDLLQVPKYDFIFVNEIKNMNEQDFKKILFNLKKFMTYESVLVLVNKGNIDEIIKNISDQIDLFINKDITNNFKYTIKETKSSELIFLSRKM